MRASRFLVVALMVPGFAACAPADIAPDAAGSAEEAPEPLAGEASPGSSIAAPPLLDPGDRTFQYSTEELGTILVRRNDLGRGWSVGATAAAKTSPDAVESSDLFASCTAEALAAGPGVADFRSLDTAGPDLEAELTYVTSGASAFWNEEYAQAYFDVLSGEAWRSCVLDELKSSTIRFAGEEGFLVLNPRAEVVRDIVPPAYGTVLLFSFTLANDDLEVPLEYAFLLIGKGSIVSFARVTGLGEYDTGFVVPMVAKMVSRVETLAPAGASITR